MLDWRPLYDIYEDMSSHNTTMCLKVYPQDFEKSLKLLIKLCRYYFLPSSTGEILAEFRPFFCPHDVIMSKAMAYCTLFLPTVFVERLGNVHRIGELSLCSLGGKNLTVGVEWRAPGLQLGLEN